MASKRKSPSFEIPDAVRQAGQSGWVYRTGQTPMKPKTTRPTAPLPTPRRSERVTVVESVESATGQMGELKHLSNLPKAALELPLAAAAQDTPAAPVPAEPPVAAVVPPEPAAIAAVPSAAPQPAVVTPVRTFETVADTPVVARAGCALTRYLVSLGLELLVAPIVVPLYLLSGLFTPPLSKY